MSLHSSSQQPPGHMSNAIGSSRESNPSRRICHLRAVPLAHVADNFNCSSVVQNVTLGIVIKSLTHFDFMSLFEMQ